MSGINIKDFHACGQCGTFTFCSACKTCHVCGPRSQKVIGLLAGQGGLYSPSPFGLPGLQVLGVVPVDCPNWLTTAKTVLSLGETIFARPCPVRPRHGFVESRQVKGQGDLIGIFEETKVADPKGEIMFSRFVKADWNAIWTPDMLVVGKGHDGATSGGGSILFQIPLSGNWVKGQFNQCKLGKDEVPFMEVVGVYRPGPSGLVTQVRSGPSVGRVKDFIPKHVKVKKVITFDPKLSLVEWETMMVNAGEEKGTVVYHPGSSITDHATIHARANQVAMVTFPITIGQKLDPPANAPPPPSPRSVAEGIAWGDSIQLDASQYEHATGLLLALAHQSGVLTGEEGIWLGLAAGLMVRMGCLALRGESRHHRQVKKANIYGIPRQQVYSRHRNRSLSFHRASIARIVNHFRYGDFGGLSCSTGGTGGMKWAACGAAMVPMFQAIRRVSRGEPDGVRDLIMALNTAINQAHNGGWWLNKFVQHKVFTEAQNGTPNPLVKALPHLAVWYHERPAGDIVEKKVKRYAEWPDTKVTTPPLGKVITDANLFPGVLVAAIHSKALVSPIKVKLPTGGFPVFPIADHLVVYEKENKLHLAYSAPGTASDVDVANMKAGTEGIPPAPASASGQWPSSALLWIEPDLPILSATASH